MIAVTSPGFVLFAALLAGLWYACPPPRRWQLLLGANLLFYAVLCPAALPVLAGSSGRRTAKKPVFLAGLAAALLPLALLKYLPAALGWQGTLANALGIGYFTLQLVSYLCDVRRGRILPEKKYARLLCYASFFLSITQGPFNRYDALMPQLDRPTVWDTDRVWRGVQRSAWGYFKKLAVADRAAVVVDAVFANPAAFDRTQLLLGGVLFTVQLYADFSGYTDIVLGVGEVLGLHLPENFRQPFFADSVKDIWARWHISLSQWLRDYIYIPLGGSRCSKARKDGNLIITFLVSGLWHGAGLTYLVWGGLHGLCQAAENHLPPRRPGKLRHALRVAGTFCILAGALWNGGVFAYKLRYVLDKAHELIDFTDYKDLFDKYETLKKISFDYAVVENESQIQVMRFAGQWKDMGTWNTLTEAMEEPSIGKAMLNDTCQNVHVLNELDVPVLCMGLKDVVVSASPEGILVSDKEQSSYIKPYVDKIDQQIMFAEKSWGSFRVLDVEDESLTIKVTLNPGHSMNYHSHMNRDEVWVVISGTGRTVVDGVERPVHVGDVVQMQAGCRHTVLADSELQLIEVQLGKEISVHDKQKFPLEQETTR